MDKIEKIEKIKKTYIKKIKPDIKIISYAIKYSNYNDLKKQTQFVF